MSVDVHVGRVALLGRVARDAGRWQTRLRALVGGRLADVLDARVRPTLARLGLGAQAEVFVRRVQTRIRVRGAVDDARLADAWADSLSENLVRQLEELAATGGGWTDTVAVFPDASTATLQWVAQRLRGVSPAWWESSIAADRSPGEALADLAFAELTAPAPARLPAALLTLHLHRELPWEQVFTAAEAARIFELLQRARRHQAHRTAGLSTPGADPIPIIDALAGRAAPLLAGVVDPAVRRLLAACVVFTADDAPGDFASSTSLAASIIWLTPSERGHEQPAPPTSPNLSRPTLTTPPTPPGRGHEHAARSDASAELPIDPAAQPDPCTADERYPLYLGGLALLLRPILQSRRAADMSDPSALVHAVLAAALERLSMPLLPDLRSLVWAQHAELIDVLTLGTPPLDGAIGEDVLDALLAALPHELMDVLERGPIPSACRLLATRLRNHADPKLGALLLRPARLEIGRGWADLYFPLATIDLALRLEGWDIDPGWIAGLGRVIRFHYEVPL